MSLLGGLVTLAGTSTNIIVSQIREETIGKPFHFFDFAPVGLGLTAIGLLVVSIAWRLLPRDRVGRSGLSEVTATTAYATEAVIPIEWPTVLATVADLELDKDGVTLAAVVDPTGQRRDAAPDTVIKSGTILVLEGDDASIDRMFARLPLAAERVAREIEREETHEELRSVEAVVQPASLLVGRTAARADLQDRFGVKLLGVGRSKELITERLRDVRLRAGDVLVLQAGEGALPQVLQQLDLLPLAERTVKLGGQRQRFGPALILAVAIALIATKLLPVAPAFFGAAVLMVVSGSLSMREAYGSLEPEVLILIGALTPLSEAVREFGRYCADRPGARQRSDGRCADRRARRIDARGDGVLAVPAQCPDGAGARTDQRCGGTGAPPQPGPVPDGGGDRCGL